MRLKTTLLGLFSLLFLGIALHQGWKIFELRSLEQTIADLKKDGYPTSGADIPLPEPTPEENAAPLYEAAIALASAHPAWTTQDDNNDDSVESGTAEGVLASLLRGADRTAIAELGPALDLAVQGSTRPYCVFKETREPVDSSERFDHSFKAMRLGELLCARAVIAADPRPDGPSARDLRAAFALGRHQATDPFLIIQMIRVHIAGVANRAMRPLLERASDPAAFAAAVQIDEPSGGVARGISTEMVYADVILKVGLVSYLGMGDYRPTLWRQLSSMLTRPYELRGARHHLERLKEANLAAQLPYREAHARLQQLSEEASNASWVERSAAPHFANILQGEELYFHHLALTRVGIILLDQKIKTGSFPEDLSEIAPELLKDPITGAPMEWLVDDQKQMLRTADQQDSWVFGR